MFQAIKISKLDLGEITLSSIAEVSGWQPTYRFHQIREKLLELMETYKRKDQKEIDKMKEEFSEEAWQIWDIAKDFFWERVCFLR